MCKFRVQLKEKTANVENPFLMNKFQIISTHDHFYDSIKLIYHIYKAYIAKNKHQ